MESDIPPGPNDYDGLFREMAAEGICSVVYARQLAKRLANKGWSTQRSSAPGATRKRARLILNGYQVGEQIGRGGMAVIHRGRALNPELQPKEVAIKVLTYRTGGACNRKRFILELCAGMEVRSPHIVTVLGSGTVGDRPYIVMEEMRQGDLHNELLRHRYLCPRDVLQLMAAAGHGAQAIADAGLVHRDIKPSNLFRDPTHTVKIGDLGLVKRLFHDDQLSIDGNTVGTPSYMCPEQVQGGPPSTAWDIYALGVTMYQLLSGRLPYVGSSSGATMSDILLGRGRPLREVAPHLDEKIIHVVESAMAAELNRRYPSPQSFAEDCQRLLDGKPTASASRFPTFSWLTGVIRRSA